MANKIEQITELLDKLEIEDEVLTDNFDLFVTFTNGVSASYDITGRLIEVVSAKGQVVDLEDDPTLFLTAVDLEKEEALKASKKNRK